jgi:hypothetical protein
MVKGMQLWPNDRMRAFFRAHIRRETGLDDAAANKLTEALVKAINRMLVWEMPQEPAEAALPAPAEKVKGGKGAAAKADDAKPGSKSEKANQKQADRSIAKAPEKTFDPYAFSAMVTLVKTGRDGLMKRLSEIRSAEHLKAFAEAQHLGIDRSLSKVDDLRKAIASAAEQRLADRKAAAS